MKFCERVVIYELPLLHNFILSVTDGMIFTLFLEVPGLHLVFRLITSLYFTSCRNLGFLPSSQVLKSNTLSLLPLTKAFLTPFSVRVMYFSP